MGGVLMLGVQSTELTKADIDRISNPLVGGVILFARNYTTLNQICDLVQHIKAISPDVMVAVDQEGGRVQRLDDASSFTRLPSMGSLGEMYHRDRDEAIKYTKDCATVIAHELMGIGIDFSFTPVLDLNRKSKVIGDRSFSSDVDTVIELAGVLIDQLQMYGMLAVGKHFPGHGSVEEDTHNKKVYDHRSIDEIIQNDLKPFTYLISSGQLYAVMTSHIIYSMISNTPASLSKEWIGDILRGQLAFDGLVFSDDLNMKGSTNPSIDDIKVALSTGCDMMLICNDFEYMDAVLNQTDISELKVYCDKTAQRWASICSKLSTDSIVCSKYVYNKAITDIANLKIPFEG